MGRERAAWPPSRRGVKDDARSCRLIGRAFQSSLSARRPPKTDTVKCRLFVASCLHPIGLAPPDAPRAKIVRSVSCYSRQGICLKGAFEMKKQKLLIGLNADYRAAKKDSPAFSFVCAGYYDSIVRAGGVPLVVPPAAPPSPGSRRPPPACARCRTHTPRPTLARSPP